MTAREPGSRPLLNRRLGEFGTTIFAEMSALALRTGAINLGQGFPDTDGPEEVREAAVRALRDGRGNQYPPGPGIPELRTAIAEHQLQLYGPTYDPDTEVLVTAGATEAIAAALLALLEPGDEVIALEPYYDSYAACVGLAGGTRVPVTLRPRADFHLDLDELRDAVTHRTRLILLNTPHNPTGTVLTREELTAVAELAVERDLLVVTDEVYEHLVFEGEHPADRVVARNAGADPDDQLGGENLLVHGLEGGLGTGTPELVAAVRTAKQYLTYVSSGPFQYAIAEALRLPDSYFEGLRADLRTKRDLLSAGLTAAGFDVYRPAGTYFVTTDIRPLGENDGFAFCRSLPDRCGVVAVPNAVFYDHRDQGAPFVRFAFCKRTVKLREAIERLSGLRKQF